VSESVDIAIVGGGIVGVCAAYCLAGEGRSVAVIEREDICARGGSTHSNAGLITPSDAYPLASPGALGDGLRWLLDSSSPFYIAPRARPRLARWLYLFARASVAERARRAMPVQRSLLRLSADLWAEIAATPGVDFGYEQRGWLWTFRDEASWRAGAAEAAEAAAYGATSEVWDAARVRAAVPGVAPEVCGGVYYTEDAHCDPRRAVEEVARLAAGRGALLRTGIEVLDIEARGRRVSALRTTAGELTAGVVVVAAGSWSPALAGRLGIDLPIEPAKGYSVTVARPADLPELPLYEAASHVAITPMGEGLRLAGTLELAGFDMRVRWNRVAAIRRGAGRALRGAAELEPRAVWRGLRPCTPDGLPIVGRSPRHDNLIVAAGHCMLGLGAAPATGALVAALVDGREPPIDAAPLRVERFA
jgi:D-amino-acid dehydrogenase